MQQSADYKIPSNAAIYGVLVQYRTPKVPLKMVLKSVVLMDWLQGKAIAIIDGT
ncbi:MAG: hypothetical protein RLZZ78_1291 [Armatimonadota bacterium]